MQTHFSYEKVSGGMLDSNTYVLWAPNGEAAILDLGNAPELVEPVVEKHHLTVRYLVLTHAHVDHIYYLEEFRRCYPEAEVVCHEADQAALGDEQDNVSLLFGLPIAFAPGDHPVVEGDFLTLGGEPVKILATPGHTPGCICLLAEGLLFTGDTLFRNSIGRTDLGRGCNEDMVQSLRRLCALDPELVVLPGHGPASTIGREGMHNPYRRWWEG